MKGMSDTEDPYAISDSDDEQPKGPPPKIQIEGRTGDLTQLKSALNQQKEKNVDTERVLEIQALKEKKEAKNIKQDFETGKISAQTEADFAAEKALKEEEKKQLTAGAKENYSKFKDKFEHIDNTLGENLEERLKGIERDKLGLGKESLNSAKERFEKGLDDGTPMEKEKVEIQRSEADKKRIIAAFQKDMTAEDAPKDCAVCNKIVYPVERVFCNKQLYHKECFCCVKCQKKLLPTNYNCHEGKLYCKVHMLEIFHPEAAKAMDPMNTEEDDHDEVESEDEDEFAVSSKPKRGNKNVVKSGAGAISDELAQIRSLKEKKGDFESSIRDAEKIDKKTVIEEEIQSGRVKANMDRFVSGAADDEKKIEREELHFDQVGDIKNKWKTGQVETAEQQEAGERAELEKLKGGPSVKERFRERAEGEEEVKTTDKHWDASQLDTSLTGEQADAVRAFLGFLRRKMISEQGQNYVAAEARKSFLEGRAYEDKQVEKSAADLGELKFGGLSNFKEKFEKGEGDITEVQKTQIDIDGISLGDIKNAFECKGKSTANMTPEERAEQKKKEIEAEFMRYKLARKAASKRAAEQAEAGKEAVVIGGADQASGAGVGNIKDKFDNGKAYTSAEAGKEGLDVEIKVAGKARAKFQQLDASGAQPIAPKDLNKKEPSKWDKKEGPVGEVVNRRVTEDEPEEEDEDSEEFDVKNLMNKFKNISDDPAKSLNTEQRAELERLQVGAKNIKQQFEKGETSDSAADDAKRRQMQEEFEALKKERETMQKRLEEERAAEDANRTEEKEEIGVRAEHASKMAAKWEKIQQKEAKKAEKGKMPAKGTIKFSLKPQPKCSVCTTTVYVAEQFQCFGLLYHTKCFRCTVCHQHVRVERVQRSKEGALFCQTHFVRTVEKKGIDCSVNNNNDVDQMDLVAVPDSPLRSQA